MGFHYQFTIWERDVAITQFSVIPLAENILLCFNLLFFQIEAPTFLLWTVETIITYKKSLGLGMNRSP